MATPTWHGTQAESMDLTNAISRNCSCKFGLMGIRLETCAPHEMLLTDQRALDGLLCSRERQAELVAEEWCQPKP